jgi:hypothetical protein
VPLLVVIALVGGALALPIERASAAGAAPTGFSAEVSADAKSGAVRVAGVPPTGFSDTVAISGLVQPTAVAFGGDGRVFVAEKSGLINVFDSLSDTTPTVFADLRTQVHNFWDRGMLGLTLDPQFPTRPYVYALYTYDAVPGGTAPRWGTAGGTSDGCPNPPGATADGCVVQARLSRLTASGNQMTGSEQVLVTGWCNQFPSHSIGTVTFGPDGALYVGAGDGASFNYTDYGQTNNACGDSPSPAGTDLAPTQLFITGTFTPVAGDFTADGADDIFFYGPGTALDVLWEFNAGGGHTELSIPVSGTYLPLVGSFGFDATDDIFWYAAGTAADSLWDFNPGSTSRTSRAIAVDGTYTPFTLDLYGDGAGGGDIFWYAPGTATDTVWDFIDGVRFPFRDPVNGTYRPMSGDYLGDIVWLHSGGFHLWVHRPVTGGVGRFRYSVTFG